MKTVILSNVSFLSTSVQSSLEKKNNKTLISSEKSKKSLVLFVKEKPKKNQRKTKEKRT